MGKEGTMTKPKAPAGAGKSRKLAVKKSTIKDLSVKRDKGAKVRGGDGPSGLSHYTDMQCQCRC